MPDLTGRLWLSLSVRDIDASVEWYTRVLEFEVTAREGSTPVADGTALLRHRSGIELGLIALRDNAGESFSEFRSGLDHIELWVARDELRAWVARLDALGVTHSGVKAPGGHEGSRVVTLRDPDNIQIELYVASD